MTKPVHFPVAKLVRMNPEMAARISKCRFECHVATEAETMRLLFTLALDRLDQVAAENRAAKQG
jgi:hypothetical protein